MTDYFKYGDKEIAHLKRADKRLAAVIERIGVIERPVIPDLFSALVHSVIGQQISTKAHQTVWERMQKELKEITPDFIDGLPLEELQKLGTTFKKAAYIKLIAQKIISEEFDINSLYSMPDEEVCAELSGLNGIGVWTAEMLMIFSMQRPNILSYGDLAIHRGLRMVYHHRKIDRAKFDNYWKRYTPYASVASLYLWAVAGGAIEEMKDYAPKKKKS
jgi:DNA-3-methyladenine glycosylase II